MSFEEVMAAVQRLSVATDAFAAVGAELKLRSWGEPGDPAFVSALRTVREAAGIPDLDSLAPPQQAMVLGIVQLYLAQADELVSDPARPPGWTFTNPLVLDGMGRRSMMIRTLLAAAPEFEKVTSLLDVGTGVGLLAVAAANVWSSATVVGIDTWEPSLERARANVSAAGLDDRITLRKQDATTIDDVDEFDCAWIPTFFLSEQALNPAIPKIVTAVRPDGWVVLGRFDQPPDPLARATSQLRTARSGGCTIDVAEATELLQTAGCTSVHELERTGPLPMGFVIGQKS